MDDAFNLQNKRDQRMYAAGGRHSPWDQSMSRLLQLRLTHPLKCPYLVNVGILERTGFRKEKMIPNAFKMTERTPNPISLRTYEFARTQEMYPNPPAGFSPAEVSGG